MEPGQFAVRSWIPKQSKTEDLNDSLTIYDAGNIQGFLWISSTGKTNWIVFQVDYRLQQEDGSVVEGCDILHETQAPLHYFSIETYPMTLQQVGKLHFLFSLPQTEILMTLSEEILWEAREPQKLPLLPQPLQPSPGQSQSRDGPVSRGPPKSGSWKQVDGQRRSQNRNTSLPKSKALPSSNQGAHGRHLSQVPKKQEVSHPQYSPTRHTGHESSESPPWLSLAQQSPYSRPPPEVE